MANCDGTLLTDNTLPVYESSGTIKIDTSKDHTGKTVYIRAKTPGNKFSFKQIKVVLSEDVVLPAVEPTSKTPFLDSLINFFTAPSSKTMGVLIGKLPWDIVSPYIGGFIALLTYDQYEKQKETFKQTGIDQPYLY